MVLQEVVAFFHVILVIANVNNNNNNNNNIILRFTRCSRLNTILKMLLSLIIIY